LRVTAAAERSLRAGHPWVFADSVRAQNRPGQAGELAVIYDRQDRFLAVGLFDPDSPLRVRALHTGKPVPIDRDWWRDRLRAALARRAGLFDAQTTGWRCVSGESDGWPGLVLDRYDTTLVLKLYTAAWLPRLAEVLSVIETELPSARVVLRLSRNIQATARDNFGLTEGLIPKTEVARTAGVLAHGTSDFGFIASGKAGGPASAASEREGLVTFLETGLRFEADVVRGQKTGFFLDQRENRRIVGSLAAGRGVLNAFSFSGGFSLYAARGGARSVTDLDISPHALESAKRNFALNCSIAEVARCPHATVQTDAFEWLEKNPVRRFDLVILDPPSLARRESERTGAIQAYRKLAAAGIRWLRPGGLLVASSCSAHVSAEEFFGAVREAARSSRRKFEELQTTGHPPDHPATFPEAQYLKCLYARFTA
jgi:23S rRNA (cytosine1962-C5)-methyltransferase